MSKKGPENNIGERSGEEFDREHPMAGVIRKLTPPDVKMRPESRARMIQRLLAMQRKGLPAGGRRNRFKWKYALVPAAAASVVAVIILALVLSPVETTEPGKSLATIESMIGTVEMMPEGGDWVAADYGQSIATGAHVRTADGSSAVLAFPDGSIMRVTDGSEARVRDIGDDKVLVEHLGGGTYHRVNEGTEYIVMNEGISLKALGTAFNVENRVPGNLELVTVESAVEVGIGEHEPIEVIEGEVLVVSTVGEKKADKQPVSRERLQEDRLYTSAKEDKKAGYSTGIYEKLDVHLGEELQEQVDPEDELPGVELGGNATETGAVLEWGVAAELEYDALALLRSDTSEPEYPDDEIALFTDTSMQSATDDSVERGKTYQYRAAALLAGGPVALSNTLVLTMPEANPKPKRSSVSLVATVLSDKVFLEWSVKGAKIFDGYVVERVVTAAPDGSSTSQGTPVMTRIETMDILYSYTDESVKPRHEYTYRVGLVVDGTVMVYSPRVTVAIPQREKKS